MHQHFNSPPVKGEYPVGGRGFAPQAASPPKSLSAAHQPHTVVVAAAAVEGETKAETNAPHEIRIADIGPTRPNAGSRSIRKCLHVNGRAHVFSITLVLNRRTTIAHII